MTTHKDAGCWHQQPYVTECLPALLNRYECHACGEAWEDQSAREIDDECPACGERTQPYNSIELASCACGWLAQP